MLYICIAFSIIIPYLICSINPAIVVSKIKLGKDIREMGSGNAGLTNTLRTMGKGAAAVVLLFDVLKGVISVLAVAGFCILTEPWYGFVCNCPDSHFCEAQSFLYLCKWLGALFATLGHCYPIYYKFKGGKAVLVTVATGLVINPTAALSALCVFIIIVLISKYVSLGSVLAAVIYPVGVGLFEHFVKGNNNTSTGVVFSALIAVLLVFNHRGNIVRLLKGTEKKLGEKKSV